MARRAGLLARAIDDMEAGRFERAARQLLALSKKAARDWRLPNDAGLCYYRLERYDDAIAAFDRALCIAPKEVPVLFNKGLAQALAGRDHAALETFRSLLELDPSYGKAYFEIGKIMQKRRRWKDAVEYFDTALVQDTTMRFFSMTGSRGMDADLHSLVFLNKARIQLLHLGQVGEGLGQVRMLVDKLGHVARAMVLANELVAAGKSALARRVLGAVLAHEPTHEGARALRAGLRSGSVRAASSTSGSRHASRRGPG